VLYIPQVLTICSETKGGFSSIMLRWSDAYAEELEEVADPQAVDWDD
jgi:hypothetical protein